MGGGGVFGTKAELGQILNAGNIITCIMILNTLYAIKKKNRNKAMK